ncbi:DNA phosphorothioation-associated protein 4 [Luteolibacter marinus]|uniref:DNA phosphorothioation-associated protein 4 n=1 Tax=Luteolibacter marinus TaxID=2776705 RepID=UPI0018674F6E|nr:DNA phosphorothioation-associated protein 4 [Luteolibacter marinus]
MSPTTNLEKAPGSKRIHRARDKEEVINELLNLKPQVFREIWRVLLFAASLGYSRDRRVPLAAVEQGKGIDQATFGNCPSWPGILYILSLNQTQSEECLKAASEAEDLRVRVFEEFANGGLEIIGECLKEGASGVDALIDLLPRPAAPAEGPRVDFNIQLG